MDQANTNFLGFAALSIALLVFLVVRLKVSAFIALIVVSVALGLATGMQPGAVLLSFQKGVGGVLESVAMIIALGTILGKFLGDSGGAELIARRIVAAFGTTRLPWAFLLIGFLVGLPVFFAVGLVLLVPILDATCREHRVPRLKLGLPMLAGLSAAHGLVPPHPGPIAAIGLLGADLGKTLLLSIPVALFAAILAGPVFARMLPRELLETPTPGIEATPGHVSTPSFAASLSVILLPLVLMSLTSITHLAGLTHHWLQKMATVSGHPIVALLIGVFCARFTLARGLSAGEFFRKSEAALAPVASILLVIAAGAGFSRVLIDSGVGKEVELLAKAWALPVLPMGFTLAALIRVATGSATVAITTCAGLIKPLALSSPGTNLELLVLAMGAGSLILSHVNDGGFWLVKSYLNLSVPQTVKTWTVLETILALGAFAAILLCSVLL